MDNNAEWPDCHETWRCRLCGFRACKWAVLAHICTTHNYFDLCMETSEELPYVCKLCLWLTTVPYHLEPIPDKEGFYCTAQLGETLMMIPDFMFIQEGQQDAGQ